MSAQPSGRPCSRDVRELVSHWYSAIDRHADVDVLVTHLASAGLSLRFPERTVSSHQDFHDWYTELTNVHFDQRREPLSVAVDMRSPIHADVTVRVSWQARRWEPPAARSRWTGCVLTETWTVVWQQGRPRIRTLVTHPVGLFPGSAPLPRLRAPLRPVPVG